MALVGKVVSITGVAYLIAQDESRRELILGDQVQVGDTIETPRGVEVELELTNGRLIYIHSEQLVQFTEELSEALAPSNLDSAVNLATIETVIKAIEEGKDINAVLEETAAGQSSSYNSYGFSFVDLFRINDILNAFNFAYSYELSQTVDIDPLIEGNDINYSGLIAADGPISNPNPNPPINIAPVAANITVNGAEDDASIIITLTGTDADGTIASITLNSLPANGLLYEDAALTTLVVAGNAYLTNAATFYFVPNANFNGNTGFSYTVTDDLGLSGATPANATIVVAAVNDTPVVNDDSFAVIEDRVLTGNVLSNDTDADGDSLSVTQFTVDTDGDTIPEVFAAGTIATIAGVGTIVVNVNGGFIFTPAINYNGSVPEVGYTLSDGILTNTGTLNLGPITPVNDAPNAIADIVSTPVDTPVTLTPLSNDTDAEGDSLTLATIGGVAVTPGAPQSIPVSNGIINITAGGVISFTPNSGFSGVSVIPYTISDGADTDAANITINVSANVSPQGADTTRTIIEDGSYTFLSADFGFTDSDIDQTLNAVRIDSLPISGALFLNGLAITTTGQTITVADIDAGNLTFVPAANANGSPYG
ncbi:MAG: retention module-containing protein, partial [Pseudomonadota bacterium]